jgi:hypothetical protein
MSVPSLWSHKGGSQGGDGSIVSGVDATIAARACEEVDMALCAESGSGILWL